jgi:hypothetical protein
VEEKRKEQKKGTLLEDEINEGESLNSLQLTRDLLEGKEERKRREVTP